jgi:hypothetical protein
LLFNLLSAPLFRSFAVFWRDLARVDQFLGTACSGGKKHDRKSVEYEFQESPSLQFAIGLTETGV